MKTFTFLLGFLFGISGLHAQNYQISFTGSGHHTYVDSVHVKNQTQGTTVKLGGGDVLHLIAPVGIIPMTSNEHPLTIFPIQWMNLLLLSFFILQKKTLMFQSSTN